MKTTVKRTKKTAEARYALRKGLGFWELTFNGQHAVFKHEQGAYYAAYLLLNPPEEPMHGLALELKVNDLYGQPNGGATEMVDPGTGRKVLIEAGAFLQERNLALDDAEGARALRRTQRELEAIVEDEQASEPVKAEVMRELEELYEYQKKHLRQTRNTAQKAADAVGKALKRFYGHLSTAVDGEGHPHPVLRSFAAHLKAHLLIASGRGCAPGGPRPGPASGGCFTYQPPAGVVWRS